MILLHIMKSCTIIFYLLLLGVALAFVAIVRTMCWKSKSSQKKSFNDRQSAKPSGAPHPEMIEVDKITKERIRRYKDFELFFNQAYAIFEPFKNKDKRTKYLQATNMLCICPGGRNGGRDKRVVEVFWGQKLYDQNERVTEHLQIDHFFYSATGASILFYKNDDGYVTIYLIPAGTDLTHPEEDGICWEKKVDPSKLLSKCYQRRAWWSFMAYMEVTQLDGDSSIIQRLYIWYMRYFHNLVVDKKWQRTKAMDSINSLVTWFPMVALSGVAIFILQLLFVPSPAEHENVTNIIDNAVEIKERVNEVDKELDDIRERQDSLIKGQKYIEKAIINNQKN